MQFEERSSIEEHIPHIGIALQEILDLRDKDRDETVDVLENALQKSLGF